MTYPHWLHIYQKPAQGSAFIRRLPIANYKHTILANGGFDKADCQLALPRRDAELGIEQWVGNRAAVYVNNPAEPIWEGLISRIRLTIGSLEFTRSLDKLYNRATVTYTLGGTPNKTAATNNTDSQAIYGIKEGRFEVGYKQSGGLGFATTRRDSLLALQAWPQNSTPIGGASGYSLKVEMIGFYHTLSWEQTTVNSSDQNPNVVITDILSNLANSNTFLDNTNTDDLNDPVSFNMHTAGWDVRGKSAWDAIQWLAEIGDGTNRWVAYVTPPDFSSGLRHVAFEQANSDIDYIYYVRDGLRIRNRYGGILSPWTIRPNRGIRLNDVLIGWNAPGDDPREMYITAVEYDAEQQNVSLRGSDDITTEGTFQLSQQSLAYSEPFGQRQKVH